METPKNIKDVFNEYTIIIDDALEDFFAQLPQYDMYKHMAYFMGFADEKLIVKKTYGGKRTRSALALMLGDWYGVKDMVVPVALSLELYHNFTLMHDDIVDGDTHRRGKPTVWNMWGQPHAINDGDAQLILSNQIIASGPGSAEMKLRIQQHLSSQYLKVIEGQHLDFILTDLPLGDSRVTQESYFEMVGRKTADLIAAATKVPGIVANLTKEEQEALFEYGYSLGVAYQLCDDAVSIWGSEEMTGKRAHGDVLERKKTYPVFHALNALCDADRETFLSLYNQEGEMSGGDVLHAVKLLDSVSAYEGTRNLIEAYAEKAKTAAERLTLSEEKIKTLCRVVDVLLPPVERV